MGVVAFLAVLAVLGMVFAVGALRIKIADDGSSAAVADAASPAMSQPAVLVGQPSEASDEPSVPIVPILSFESLEFPAESATLTHGLKLEEDKLPPPRKGGRAKARVGPPDAPPKARRAITGWQNEEDVAEWTATLPKQGFYEVDVVCACAAAVGGFNYIVKLGDQELKAETNPLRGGRGVGTYNMLTVGTTKLPAGEVKIRFHLTGKSRGLILRLQGVRLIPAS
jgi:hypothetical protein